MSDKLPPDVNELRREILGKYEKTGGLTPGFKPYAQLHQENRQINKLKEYATKDSLTGAYNRRYLYEALHDLDKKGKPYALLMIDIDNFKTLNDRYGHEVGDRFLKHFVTAAHEIVREADIVARHGGEEFVIALPGRISKDILEEKAEALRAKYSEMSEIVKGQKIESTLSIGGTFSVEGSSVEKTVDAADQAMYRVKQTTKNAVFVNN